jgi:DNA polymerase/3'-5' exonuclease PolX
MGFDYQRFEITLKEKVQLALNACVEKLTYENIAGFALCSDESAMSISVLWNKYEHFNGLLVMRTMI